MPAVTSVTNFSDGNVLTAAALNAVNCGIHVYSNSTARDAAYGGSGERTLVEGEYAYLLDTNQTLVYSGSSWVSVGTTPGLVPIVPTSVTVGSGSATTSANGLVTFTGASSISLNGVFSATYNNYRIILSPDAASTLLDIQARLRISGADVTTASSYQQENMFASDNTVTGQSSTGNSIWEFINNYNATYPVYAICVAELQRPFLTKKKTAITNSSFVTNAGAFRTRQSGYTQESTSACDGLSIICSTGNIGGTISVYGYTI